MMDLLYHTQRRMACAAVCSTWCMFYGVKADDAWYLPYRYLDIISFNTQNACTYMQLLAVRACLVAACQAARRPGSTIRPQADKIGRLESCLGQAALSGSEVWAKQALRLAPTPPRKGPSPARTGSFGGRKPSNGSPHGSRNSPHVWGELKIPLYF